jgi:uncharacterized protein YydD (DUF2326 family)
MQISRIYSNNSDLFEPIDFNLREHADRLNIIFGEVHHPKDKKRDSHNLGKTTLIYLIDFLMLKGTSPGQFLVKHRDRFAEFTFFIEIALNSGDFATVRRGALEPNLVGMRRHPTGGQDFANSSDTEWDHPALPQQEAVTLLDAWLDLRILKPYDYRKAITYFLRAQGDYNDELQLGKFAVGKDRHWKPFIAHLFGFNEAPIERKYELDEEIEGLRKQQAQRQAEVQFTEDQLPELSARIAVLQLQVDEIEQTLDAFRFDEEERRIVKDVVDGIEAEIAEINDRLYNIRYDVRQIDSALKHKDRFDLREVEQIFGEAEVYFPKQLRKEYEELVAFNKRITQERNTTLRARKKTLEAEEGDLHARKRVLDDRREQQLRVIRGTDTFEKFKELQKELSHQRANLVYLDEQRKKLEQVADLARRTREAERDRGRVVDEIKAMLARPAPPYERFGSVFNKYCQRVLNRDGLFYFKVNNSNNLDYVIGLSLPGQTGAMSSQSEGTSYKKLVCALFDLALLKTYEDVPFFHFCYHDGVLEGLDDRKKIALLDLIRGEIADKKTQYIFTMIDADVPRDASGRRIKFGDDEIVLRLSDEGPSGRLFKMGEF